jgi:hypothetical protein
LTFDCQHVFISYFISFSRSNTLDSS